MKLTKKNKRELKAISAVLILFAIVFLWIVQTIGLPRETYIAVSYTHLHRLSDTEVCLTKIKTKTLKQEQKER